MGETKKLKRCPCGEVPKELHIITEHEHPKYAIACGMCCGEWFIEFRNNYESLNSGRAMELAVVAWNESTRDGVME